MYSTIYRSHCLLCIISTSPVSHIYWVRHSIHPNVDCFCFETPINARDVRLGSRSLSCSKVHLSRSSFDALRNLSTKALCLATAAFRVAGDRELLCDLCDASCLIEGVNASVAAGAFEAFDWNIVVAAAATRPQDMLVSNEVCNVFSSSDADRMPDVVVFSPPIE